MDIIEGEVLVIGMARQGKSHLGNAIAGFPEEELFPTADGCTSCTSEIKSEQLNGLQSDIDKTVTFNIKYTDTPGFPDSDGSKTVDVFDNIVKFINNTRPDAIVWLINPGNRNPEDEKMYQSYSMLLKEFSRSGIYCTVLVNNQGSKNKYKNLEKKQKGWNEIRGQIKDYGYGVFSPFDPEISLHEEELADTLLNIVVKATRAKGADDGHSLNRVKMRTFQDMKDMYLKQFDTTSKKTEAFLKSKNCKLSAAKSEMMWHEERIENCTKLLSHNWVGKVGLAAGFTLDLIGVSLGFGTVAAESINQMTERRLELNIIESRGKISRRKRDIMALEHEIANRDSSKVMLHAKQLLEEYIAILNVLRRDEDIKDIKKKHPKLIK